MGRVGEQVCSAQSDAEDVWVLRERYLELEGLVKEVRNSFEHQERSTNVKTNF